MVAPKPASEHSVREGLKRYLFFCDFCEKTPTATLHYPTYYYTTLPTPTLLYVARRGGPYTTGRLGERPFKTPSDRPADVAAHARRSQTSVLVRGVQPTGGTRARAAPWGPSGVQKGPRSRIGCVLSRTARKRTLKSAAVHATVILLLRYKRVAQCEYLKIIGKNGTKTTKTTTLALKQ